MFPTALGWLIPQRPNQAKAKRRGKPRYAPHCESLESRELLAAAVAVPSYVHLTWGGVSHFAGPGPTGYSPAQITQAYGINQISFNGTPGDGTGTTIAIVDAYDDPTIANDLKQFDAAYGLPDPVFTKVNQNGGSNLPAGNPSWAEETSLDVEWAHAVAPKASILLVEANSASFADLLTGVQFAASQPGVVDVSMSWGAGEFSGENLYDGFFTTPSGHAGVTFIASSGDSGAPPGYPAISPNVLSVGGTTLNITSSGSILSETGWSGSGGGISSFESQPAYQNGVVTQSSTARTNPDVAYDSDPNTGFSEYNSYSFPTAPWQQFGGTSDAAPQWAGIIAIADQGRALAGLGSLDGPSQTLPMIYSVSAGDFNDITSGTSTGSPFLSAGPGYDLVTGRGSPIANKLVADLVGSSGVSNNNVTHFSVSAPSTDTAGNSFSVTVTALNSSNAVVTNYAGTVKFSSNDPAAGLPVPYQFNGMDAGVHTFTVTLYTAGNRTVTVADQSAGGVNGTATVSVSAATASKLAFAQQPSNALVGAVISPAVTVQVQDAYGNLETGDNTDQVTVAFGSNPGSATLGGTLTANVSGGVATFNNLTVSAPGTGYTLSATSASSPSLTSATSNTFNVTTSTANLLEGFETTNSWYFTNINSTTAYRNSAAAHDGNYGLVIGGSGWIYRTDSAVHNQAGDTLSVWVKFPTTANGRAYFGFGSSSSGTYSLVAAPNTNQLILMWNPYYSYYFNLAATTQTYQANHWYRMEVDWGMSGAIIGKLFDSNGTTLLSSVSTSNPGTGITFGGIAFRSTASNRAYFDTVTDTPGVNPFVVQPPKSSDNPPTWGNPNGPGATSASAPPRTGSSHAAFFASLAGPTTHVPSTGSTTDSGAAWYELLGGSI